MISIFENRYTDYDVKDDAMSRYCSPGDTVLVDIKRREKPGDIVLVVPDAYAKDFTPIIRRYERDGEKKLVSDNPGKYPDVKAESAAFLGVVVKVIKHKGDKK